MAYQALYRVYRPQIFEEVVEQSEIIRTLKHAIDQDKVAHAYLFCGPRGTGKTTIAKLLAKGVNCLDAQHKPCGQCVHCQAIQEGSFPDVIEIDAASNNGVDQIRDLIEKVKYAPLEGRRKVYIIDEVHMLSQGAFNALLKTLEEPPEHVVFILATTEIHKVPATIISRCQRFDFRQVEPRAIANYLTKILEREGRIADKGVCEAVAELAEGGMRDALTILEQVMMYAEADLHVDDVYTVVGLATPEQIRQFVQDLGSGNVSGAMDWLNTQTTRNADLRRLSIELTELLKECVVYQETEEQRFVSERFWPIIQNLKEEIPVNMMLEEAVGLMERLKTSMHPETDFELMVLQVTQKTRRREVFQPITKQQSTKQSPQPLKDEPEKKVSLANKESHPVQSVQPIDANEPNGTEQPMEPDDKPMFDHTLDELIHFMVNGNKQDRRFDQTQFEQNEVYCSDLKWMKTANLLRQAQVVLSGDQFIFFDVENIHKVRILEQPALQEELLHYMDVLFDKKKQPFFVTTEEFKLATAEFLVRMKAGTLPEKGHLQLQISEKAQPTYEDQLSELFGDKLIVEDD